MTRASGVRSSWLRLLRKLVLDRKSTRLNSSHVEISYAVFCLKKNKTCALRSEEHTSELQSRRDLRCRLLLLKKKKQNNKDTNERGERVEGRTRVRRTS